MAQTSIQPKTKAEHISLKFNFHFFLWTYCSIKRSWVNLNVPVSILTRARAHTHTRTCTDQSVQGGKATVPCPSSQIEVSL